MSLWNRHAIFEKNSIILIAGILGVIAIGGLVEITPLFYLKSTIEVVDGIRPYTPLELTGRNVGVPYTAEQIANAKADLKAQVDPDGANADAFQKRYPKAVVRNFDGKPGNPTELDALVAYLQMLGTLVDFKLYDEKANLR